MTERRRIPAAEREAMLVEAGIEIARAEGGRSVTLARVAEACGVTKPIAYRLFADLPDLLAQMQQRILAGYEAVIAQALRRAMASGASRAELLEVLSRTYVEHNLADGAVYDTVSAALAATAAAEEPLLTLPDSYLALARDLFGLPAGQETAAVAMFLGAADYLVAAVQTGLVTSQDAIAQLTSLFAPLLAPQEQP